MFMHSGHAVCVSVSFSDIPSCSTLNHLYLVNVVFGVGFQTDEATTIIIVSSLCLQIVQHYVLPMSNFILLSLESA